MAWVPACTKVRDYMVRVETHDGHGSGFFFAYNEARSVIAVATALHVVVNSHDWRRPLKIRRMASNEEVFLRYDDRAILVDYRRDSAAILLSAKAFKDPPKEMLPLMPRDKILLPGADVMWTGYPGIDRDTMCYFKGTVSAFKEGDDSYYLDGVAINGVSGGPVFDEDFEKNPTRLIGIVAAYFVNRQRGETLPGFAVAHDVTHLHDTIKAMKDLDEARAKEEAERLRNEAEKAPAGAPEASEVRPEGGGGRDGKGV